MMKASDENAVQVTTVAERAPRETEDRQTAQAAYERFQRVRFFSCLDGLRAFSVLAVIWHHTAATAAPEGWEFLHRGNRGVMLFFVISGFLITTLLIRAKASQTLSVPRFWARRALRILPLYYAVLALYLAVVYFFEADPAAKAAFLGNLPAFATFTSNWFVDLDNARVIFYFAWSLAAEEQFYLCWPWIERYAPRGSPMVVAGAGLVLTQAVGFMIVTTGSEWLSLRILASVPAAILLGVILAHVMNSRRRFAGVWVLAGGRASGWLAAIAVSVALSVESSFGFLGELMTACALTFLVAACVVREDNALAPVLRWRPIAWIGAVSYGIYLLHMLSVGIARRVLERFDLDSPYAVFVGGAIVSIVAASISYLTFERFFLGYKERWFGDKPVSPAVAAASTPSARAAAGAVVPG